MSNSPGSFTGDKPVTEKTVIPNKVDKCGAMAQLGARLNGIQEVEGSNPSSSTIIYLSIRVVPREYNSRP